MRQYKKPMFQKRHYEAIANIISQNMNKSYHVSIIDLIIDDFIELFKYDNSLFNEEKFIDACEEKEDNYD